MDYKSRQYHQTLDTTLQGHADSSVPETIEQTQTRLGTVGHLCRTTHDPVAAHAGSIARGLSYSRLHLPLIDALLHGQHHAMWAAIVPSSTATCRVITYLHI